MVLPEPGCGDRERRDGKPHDLVNLHAIRPAPPHHACGKVDGQSRHGRLGVNATQPACMRWAECIVQKHCDKNQNRLNTVLPDQTNACDKHQRDVAGKFMRQRPERGVQVTRHRLLCGQSADRPLVLHQRKVVPDVAPRRWCRRPIAGE